RGTLFRRPPRPGSLTRPSKKARFGQVALESRLGGRLAMAIQPPLQATTPEFVPMAPARTEDSGLPVARLADLLLKHIYFKSPMSAKDWAGALCLPYQTVTPAIQSLVEQGWAQTIGRMAGPSQSHDFGETLGYLITDPGRLRARDVLARDHYVGPAPVPFAQYD